MTLREELWVAVRSVYDRHDQNAPLNHVNMVEFVNATEQVINAKLNRIVEAAMGPPLPEGYQQ